MHNGWMNWPPRSRHSPTGVSSSRWRMGVYAGARQWRFDGGESMFCVGGCPSRKLSPRCQGAWSSDSRRPSRRRYVHLPRFVAEELAQHLQSRPADSEALVWVAPKGGPLRNNPYRRRVWDPSVTDSGLGGLTPHALRHTCASLMRAAGADVKEIQTQLGHRSPMITLTSIPTCSRTLSTL